MCRDKTYSQHQIDSFLEEIDEEMNEFKEECKLNYSENNKAINKNFEEIKQRINGLEIILKALAT